MSKTLHHCLYKNLETETTMDVDKYRSIDQSKKKKNEIHIKFIGFVL